MQRVLQAVTHGEPETMAARGTSDASAEVFMIGSGVSQISDGMSKKQEV